MTRINLSLALRVEALVISGLFLSIAGLELARLSSTSTWHNVVFPTSHDGVPTTGPAVAILRNSTPGWAAIVLASSFGALWIGCGWAVLRRHKEATALD
jgi:hypothetical protein